MRRTPRAEANEEIRELRVTSPLGARTAVGVTLTLAGRRAGTVGYSHSRI